MSHTCRARQHSDQMICAACGLIWDMNDPEPPECRKNIKRVAKIEEEAAVEMVKTYQANAGGLSGMQAAYRLFLDRVEL